MAIQEEFEKLVDRLKTERDELKLKMHLASMEVKEEFDEAEKKWDQLKNRAIDIADGAVETSDEYIDKAKIVGDELKEAYNRIASRLRK
ncbi:hypothetical protein [Desulfopila aestuarii]|uniref:Uncharacterized protein n=1 Tax=Desulfopila aestuarii DSM 18488 TaxID=1121416 RepID=A0A1M7YB23_9BACT|nr:hypothetical protein [Desulfopila aestuarii]SHO49812.1 hypothetical protein SAMN02745220_03106 [Desulfopila aestuarii DSM 18488]